MTTTNEIFFDFGRSVQKNVFDQSRLSAGVDYQVHPVAKVQIGYVDQYIQKADGVRFEKNHTLTLSVFYTVALSRLFGF
ncbi:MAG: DUF2490 domain-containing protein [Blastocatellia bacterium]|nr:DUF2490 domain-containing protein [Blastocatellia bacterium]